MAVKNVPSEAMAHMGLKWERGLFKVLKEAEYGERRGCRDDRGLD